MKALSFLGTSDYQTVTYDWQGEKTCETHLFPEAVVRIFEPEKLVLFVTPEAAEAPKLRPAHPCPECGYVASSEEKPKHLATLKERLGERVEPVPIPAGQSEAELWQIFEACVESVEEGEEVLLDITHAFRSLPLVVFAAAAYLRRTKNVTLRHIVYGAFEARDEANRAPIFDLTPLVDLLDWVSGAESFLRLGDASLLGEKLVATQGGLWRARPSDELPRKLQTVGNQLRSLSRALALSRPREVMRHANALLPMLDEVVGEAERWTKPFAVILDRVRHSVALLAYAEPDRLDRENLRVQLRIIEHYLDKGRIIQAVLLAREWMVSWAILRRGEGDWLDRDYREKEIERTLNGAAFRKQGEWGEMPAWLEAWSDWETLGEIWGSLTQLRNDLAHCGMRRKVTPIVSIERQAREIPEKLHGLLSETPDGRLPGHRVNIDLEALYEGTAKLDQLPHYLERAQELAGEGAEVVLTGRAPIWLYLAVAHAIHGKARRLLYESPATGEIMIFDHDIR